jgi:hypothetical protein
MRDLALIGSILGMLLLASASPTDAQTMVDMSAAMGVNGALNGTASGATTALKARETVMSHTSSSGGGGGGWEDGGTFKQGSGSTGKAWATASSGSTSTGKNGWASPASSSSGSVKGWASANGQTGKSWARRKDSGGGGTHAPASYASTTSATSGTPTSR